MIEWEWCSFADMKLADLYEVLAQRQNVFILEQTCLWPDIDGLDTEAHHLMGWRLHDGKRQLAAYLRILAPGAKYQQASLGRVMSTQAARGTGAGRELMRRGLELAERLHPGHDIKIGAQRYLEQFYQGFGFETISEPYEEDGIMHVDMLRKATLRN